MPVSSDAAPPKGQHTALHRSPAGYVLNPTCEGFGPGFASAQSYRSCALCKGAILENWGFLASPYDVDYAVCYRPGCVAQVVKAAGDELRANGVKGGRLAMAIGQPESLPLQEAALEVLMAELADGEIPTDLEPPSFPPVRPSREIQEDAAVLAAAVAEHAAVVAACGRALRRRGKRNSRHGTGAEKTDATQPAYNGWRSVQVKAGLALAWLHATAELFDAVDDERPQVREAACLGVEGLAKLRQKTEASRPSSPAIPNRDANLADVFEALVDRLEDEAEAVRIAAADAVRAVLLCRDGGGVDVEAVVPKLEPMARRSDSAPCSVSGASRRIWKDPLAKLRFDRAVKEAMCLAQDVAESRAVFSPPR